MRRAIPLLTLLVLAAVPATAQLGRAPALSSLPGSTRASGLGNAFVLTAREGEALFYNPAALAGGGTALGVQRYGSASTLATVAGAAGGNGGAIGLGLQALSYTEAFRGGEEGLLSEGTAGASQLAASLGVARPFRGVRLGAGAKLLARRLEGREEAAVALDFGALKRFRRLAAGVAVQDIDLGTPDRSPALPARVTLGVSTERLPLGPLDVLGTAALGYRDGDLAPGAGLEVAYWPVEGYTLTGRGGVRGRPEGAAVTVGAAFQRDNLHLEYAYEDFVAGGAHRIGIAWR